MITVKLVTGACRIAIITTFAMAVPPSKAFCQQGHAAPKEAGAAGSVLESYLRYLQTAGMSRPYPISIRGLSPVEVELMTPPDTAHPWASRYFSRSPARSAFRWRVVGPQLSTTYNSRFPYGSNDGPVWSGKGITTSFRVGIAARWHAFSLAFAPIAFRAENHAITLMPNGADGQGRFAHGGFPTTVDRPQTFGSGAYSRIDPGESTLRVDYAGVTAGLSTASQWWGPTSEFPIVLGNNAGGFPNAFVGTSKPASIGFASLHARVVYGYLDQSPYSPVTGPAYFVSLSQPGTRRFTAGIVALAQLRAVPGLEIGGTRFFHAANAKSGITVHNLLLPFQGLLKNRIASETDSPTTDVLGATENQLASLFMRIAPLGSGTEIYVEFGREDHSSDLRDFILEPDHASLVNVGFRRAWVSPLSMTAIRAEAMSYDQPGGIQTREEGEGGQYIHTILRQGHTERGQLLAGDVGVGSGNAQMFAYDRFTRQGRLTAFVRRAVQHETQGRYVSGPPLRKATDVMNTLGIEVTRFVGNLDITVQPGLTFELNRNLESDQTNAGLAVSVRYSAW
ncbi:MAG: hypothetical protein M3R07_01090 [Gemmatimonadota bacterium]|nr:hypothetical protein [Gemmatimonadota bacterium]